MIQLVTLSNETTNVVNEIAGYTGTRKSAVVDFIRTHNIDADKLVKYVRNGSLKDKMSFVSALAGNPENKYQKLIISKFKKK